MMEPTGWEKEEVDKIDKLLRRCQLRKIAFEEQQRHIKEIRSEEQVAENLRYFATDLYSVLDYLCYLVYCHFRNKGQPSDSSEARNVKFPFKSKLRRSDVPGQETKFEAERKRFISTQFEILIGPPEARNNEEYTWLRDLILKCQIITEVDGTGQPVTPQPEPTEEAKFFSALHYLRNYTVHRSLDAAVVKNGLLYYNNQTGSHEVVDGLIDEREKDPNWESLEITPTYWIEIPPVGNNDKRFQPITIVAPRLLGFVMNIRNEILNAVFPNHF